ncbi:Quinol monooxygenase YgiN [Bryocella elongata]|uniref:Quinol monooxygenase YgiN n=1 Tax=Bryocella elongata TaxID=863522 RepID=A0A1H6BMX3_9BACT|nr:putative quinol monooxygenase [Bryocella elongata]SEG62051.1 Quinol monooxygenase YgiN [Bryocella elongata]
MISFTVRMKFRQDDVAEIAEILRQLTAASRLEPGCVSYVPHFVESEPDTVVIYEQYKDEAAVEAHRGTPHFARYAVGGLYQKMLERHVETLIAVA